MNPIDKIVVKYLISTNVPGKVFFASVLIRMQKQESTSVPTMGVTVSEGQLYLLYNPNFVELMIEKEGLKSLKGVLEHEILHIVHDHLSRAKEFNRIQLPYNLATDAAINQNIDKQIMPKRTWGFDDKGKPVEGKLIFPSSLGLPDGKDSEWYYVQLKKKAKNNQIKCGKCGGKGKCSKCGGTGKTKSGNQCPDCNGSGKCKECGGSGTNNGKPLDDHDLWKQIRDSKQMVKEVCKKVVKDAYTDTQKLKGNLPGYLEEAIQSLLKPPTVNWRQVLKRYVGASIKTGFKSSWKRPNRRFPRAEEFKGKVANRTIRILLAVDTSGSVSDKEFQDFMVEMKGILNVYKCNMTLIQCDADLHGTTEIRPYTKTSIKFKGRGGTSFVPVFNWWKKHQEYDLLIYFTDGYGDHEVCKSLKPVIWVLTEQGYNVEDFHPACGRIVKIRNKKDD